MRCYKQHAEATHFPWYISANTHPTLHMSTGLQYDECSNTSGALYHWVTTCDYVQNTYLIECSSCNNTITCINKLVWRYKGMVINTMQSQNEKTCIIVKCLACGSHNFTIKIRKNIKILPLNKQFEKTTTCHQRAYKNHTDIHAFVVAWLIYTPRKQRFWWQKLRKTKGENAQHQYCTPAALFGFKLPSLPTWTKAHISGVHVYSWGPEQQDTHLSITISHSVAQSVSHTYITLWLSLLIVLKLTQGEEQVSHDIISMSTTKPSTNNHSQQATINNSLIPIYCLCLPVLKELLVN